MTTQKTLSPILVYIQDKSLIQKIPQDAYTLCVVSTLDEALVALENCYPVLCLVDNADAVKQIRARTQAPILFIGEHTSIDAALQNGAIDCLTTPVHPDLLTRRVEQILRDSLAVYDSIPVMVQSINRQQRLRYVNKHWLNVLGYERDEVIGKPLSDFSILDNVAERIRHFQEQGYLRDEPIKLRKKSGQVIDALLDANFIQIAENHAYSVTVIRDITERNLALEAEQEQRMLAEALRDTAAAFNSTVNIDEILDIIIEHSSHIVPHINSANIMMLDDNQTQIVRHYGYEDAGYSDEVLDEINFHLDDVPNLQWVATHKQTLVITDTHTGDFKWADTQTSDFVRSIVTAPIIVDDEVVGFINLDSDKVDTFSSKHGEHLQAFANQAAIGIKNARLFAKIQQDADALEATVKQRTAALGNANKALRNQILQRQAIEDELNAERTLLRTLVDNIPDSVTVKDKNGYIILMNKAAKAVATSIVGTELAADFESRTIQDLNLDETLAQRLYEREQKVLQHGQSIINMEDNYTTTANEEHALLITKVPFVDSDGEIAGLIAINRDITKLKQAQEKLDEERLLLRTVIDHIPDNVFVKDRAGRTLLLNRAGIESMGYESLEAALLKTNVELHPSNEASRFYFEREMDLMARGESLINQEDLYTNYKGEKHWLLVTKVPIRDAHNNVIGLVGINRDITDLKQAQAELAEERNLLRKLLDTIPDAIYVKDKAHRFVLTNEATIKNMRLASLDDILGKTDDNFFPPEEAAQLQAQEKHIMETGIGIINASEKYIDIHGIQGHILLTKLPLLDASGQVTGIIGVNHDITELRQAEERLDQVLTSVRCLMWSAMVEYSEETDTYSWTTQIANEQAAQTFLPLATQNKTYTQAWLQSISIQDLQQREDLFKDHIDTQIYDFSHEIRSRLFDNRVIWLSEDIRITPIEDKWYVVGVCTDISARKAAEARLQLYSEELEEHVFERTEELLEANQAMGIEIAERKRAEEAERNQRMMAEALRDSVAAINKTLDLEVVLDTLLDGLSDAIPHDGMTIMLLEAENKVRIARQKGFEESNPNYVYDITTWGNLQRILKTGQPVITPNCLQYADWHPTPEGEWVRANLGVPIVLENEILGFITLDSKQTNAFTEQHAAWLFTFAQQAGTAIRNSRLAEATLDYATTLELRVLEHTGKLENERAQLAAILNAMQDGVMYQVGGLANTPQYANNALTEMTGFSAEEWRDGTAQGVINIENREELQELFRKIERVLAYHGHWEGETTLKHKDGRIFDAGLVRSEARDVNGERLGVVTVIRDISQEKALADQKARFIASASHELRTPIANMKTRLFLMKRRPERFMEHIEIAESVANLMQNLVEDMFDISRFERGSIVLHPEDVVLQELIRQIIIYQQPEAERKQIDIQMDFPPEDLHMQADPYRLSQVWINLIKNALNYTPVEGLIKVSLTIEADETVIKIIDNGPGIAEEALPELFQPFFRLTEDNKGAGLGLSIAREIVLAHQGSISVESTVGEGSCFIVRLPLILTLETSEMER